MWFRRSWKSLDLWARETLEYSKELNGHLVGKHGRPNKKAEVKIMLTKIQGNRTLQGTRLEAFMFRFGKHIWLVLSLSGHLNTVKLESNGLNCLVEAISR